MTGPMTNVATTCMSVLAGGAAGRRRFSEDDKRRIVDEASQPGASVSRTARRYGIAARVLFRWKEARRPKPKEPTFAPEQITDPVPPDDPPTHLSFPIIVELPPPGIDVDLARGRPL